MKIFFIRHGETVHNVAQLIAGVTDSRLTNHGVLQTQRLGAHLAERNLRFTHFFSSDLLRAAMTAQAVADAQGKRDNEAPLQVVQVPQLREQNFGSCELMPFFSKRGQDSFFDRRSSVEESANFVPKETVSQMQKRASEFLNDFIVPLLATDAEDYNTVCITSHGLFLGVLWLNFLERFAPSSVTLSSDVIGNNLGEAFDPFKNIGRWDNTSYLEVDVSLRVMPFGMAGVLNAADKPKVSTKKPPAVPLPCHAMVIRVINSHEHTEGIKKTRVSDTPYDPKQRDIAVFFKKASVEPTRSTDSESEPENSIETGEALQNALQVELAVETEKSGSRGDSESSGANPRPVKRRRGMLD